MVDETIFSSRRTAIAEYLPCIQMEDFYSPVFGSQHISTNQFSENWTFNGLLVRYSDAIQIMRHLFFGKLSDI